MTAPEGYEECEFQCFSCGTPKEVVAEVSVGTCRKWGEPGHLGHPEYEQQRIRSGRWHNEAVCSFATT